MKAIVQERYGSAHVLEFRDVEQPSPDDDEVLVRVHASSVNPADWHYMTGKPYFMRLIVGLRRPKRRIAGADMAGRVEAVGRSVTKLQPGDEVFGELDGGAYAEYVCVTEDAVGFKPHNVTFEAAASVPIAALTALQGLRDKGGIEAGHKVLINGASGGVGTFAVQIAKSLGAEVTGVCSARNAEMVRSIGADHVVDYTKDDFTHGDAKYDILFDLVASKSFSDCRRVMTRDAIYIACSDRPGGDVLGPVPWTFKTILASTFRSQKAKMFVAEQTPDDIAYLRELIESGAVTPVIDRRFDLSEVAEALRYQEAGHAQGKTVITV